MKYTERVTVLIHDPLTIVYERAIEIRGWKAPTIIDSMVYVRSQARLMLREAPATRGEIKKVHTKRAFGESNLDRATGKVIRCSKRPTFKRPFL